MLSQASYLFLTRASHSMTLQLKEEPL